jgi:hypothetical protein
MWPARFPYAAGHVVDLERELVARVDLRYLLETSLAFAGEQMQSLTFISEGVLDQHAASLAM